MSPPKKMQPPTTTKRDGTRERVLEAAALKMNLLGTASLDLVSVGKAVGMSRNALYHYVKNRDDLIYQTYLRSVEGLAQDLAEARKAGKTALQQLRGFIEIHLSAERQEQVVLKNLDVLAPSNRQIIHQKSRANSRTIAGLFEAGISQGDFRDLDPAIAAQVLLGLMEWAQLWYRFTYGASEKAIEKRAVAATVIEEIILRGIATDSSHVPCEAPDLATVELPAFDIFDEAHVAQQKRQRLLGVASRLFNERGIDSTSIDDVAAAINSTKGAVYHYFSNKTELLLACQERALDMLDLHMECAKATAGNPLDELLVLIDLQSQAHASVTPPLIPQSRLSSLPPDQAKRVVAITRRLYKIQRDAVTQRSCRLDSPAVIDLSLGASSWARKWLNENAEADSRAVTREVCSIYNRGVLVGR